MGRLYSSETYCVYILAHDGLGALKVGHTSDDRRIHQYARHGWSLVARELLPDPGAARMAEQAVLAHLRATLGSTPFLAKEDMGAVHGYTETFDASKVDREKLKLMVCASANVARRETENLVAWVKETVPSGGYVKRGSQMDMYERLKSEGHCTKTGEVCPNESCKVEYEKSSYPHGGYGGMGPGEVRSTDRTCGSCLAGHVTYEKDDIPGFRDSSTTRCCNCAQ